MMEMFEQTALASDGCSKEIMYEAWQGVAAFTLAYDWSAAVCPGVFSAAEFEEISFTPHAMHVDV